MLGIYDCDIKITHLPHALLPEGEVISAVKSGKKTVTLYVSEGYRENVVTVPNFIGMARDAAKALALENGLSCLSFANAGETITMQSIPAGSTVDGASQTLILK